MIKLSHKTKKIILIELSFILCAFLIGILPFLVNNVRAVDSLYHIQEIKELTSNLRNGIWPSFFHDYGVIGSAESTFYPWLIYIPAIISLLFHIPINIMFYIYGFIILGLMFNAIFFISYHYWHSVNLAWIFSFLSTITIEHLSEIESNDYAIVLATAIIIWVLFSWEQWLKTDKWIPLATSISLLCYIHFVSVYITLLVLIALTLLSIKKITCKKILNGCKAVILTLGLTMAIWLPIIILHFTNRLQLPINPTEFIQDNQTRQSLTFMLYPYIDIGLIMIALFVWKKLSFTSKILSVISLLLLLCMTIIPDNWIAYSPLMIMQFKYRLGNMVNILILMAIIPYFKTIWNISYNKSKILFKILCWIYAIFIAILLIGEYRPMSIRYVYHYPPKTAKQYMLNVRNRNSEDASSKTLDKDSIYQNRFYIDDYLPKDIVQSASSYEKRSGIKLGKATQYTSYYPDYYFKYHMNISHMRYCKNGIIIHANKKQRNIRIPLVVYHGQKYIFYLNHHRMTHMRYRHHELLLKTLPKGQTKITYKTPTMFYRYISAFITLLSILYTINLYKKQKS